MFPFQTQNAKKVLPTENLTHLLGNVASYMEGVIHDGGGGLSSSLVPLFDTFLRKVLLCVSELPDLNPVLRVIVATLKIPGVSAHKVRIASYFVCIFLSLTIS